MTALICAMMFFFGMQTGGLQTVLLRIGQEYGLTTAQIGFLVSMQFVSMIVIPLFAGGIGDKIGRKKVLSAALLLYCIGCVLICVSVGFGTTGISMLLMGAGYGSTQALCGALLTDIHGKESGKYQNLSQCIFGLAAFLCPLVIRQYIVSWRAVFAVSGAGTLACMIMLMRIQEPVTVLADECESKLVNTGKRYAPIAFLLFCMFLCVGLESGTTYFISTYFNDAVNAADAAAYAVSAFWIAVTITRFVFSRLEAGPLKTVCAMQICLSVVLFLLVRAASPWAAVVLFALCGCCIAPMGPMLIGEAAASIPERSGVTTSMMISASGVGSAVAPALMGVMIASMNVRTAYLVIAAVALLGGIVTAAFLSGRIRGGRTG